MYAFCVHYSSDLCMLYNCHLWPLHSVSFFSILHRSQCYYAFITSAPGLNLWKQTAVYCFGGDRVKILNRLLPHRDNTINVTVIYQKKCLTSKVAAPLSIWSNISAAISDAPIWSGVVLMVIRAVTCCWRLVFSKWLIRSEFCFSF